MIGWWCTGCGRSSSGGPQIGLTDDEWACEAFEALCRIKVRCQGGDDVCEECWIAVVSESGYHDCDPDLAREAVRALDEMTCEEFGDYEDLYQIPVYVDFRESCEHPDTGSE